MEPTTPDQHKGADRNTHALPRPQSWDEWLGLAGLTILAFFSHVEVSTANLGLVLMLIAMAARPRGAWAFLRGDRLFWIGIAFSAYVVARAAADWYADPGSGPALAQASKTWLKSSFFYVLLASFWLSRSRIRPEWLLGVALAGLTVKIGLDLDPSLVRALLDGRVRATFGSSPVIFGVWCGVVLVGLFVYRDRLVRVSARKLRYPLALLWALLIVLYATALILSQSRTGWVALTVGTFLAVLWRISRHGVRTHSHSPWGIAATAFTGAVLIGTVAYNWDIIEQRLELNLPEFHSVTTWNLDDIEEDSVRMRIEMAHVAWLAWLEKPLVGQGAGAAERLIASSPLYTDLDLGYEHPHNQFLYILLELGLIGFLLQALGLGVCLHALYRSRRKGETDRATMVFVAVSVVIIATAGLSDAPYTNRFGVFITTLILAIAYAPATRREPRGTESPHGEGLARDRGPGQSPTTNDPPSSHAETDSHERP